MTCSIISDGSFIDSKFFKVYICTKIFFIIELANSIALVNNCVGFGLSPFYGTQKVVVYDYLM